MKQKAIQTVGHAAVRDNSNTYGEMETMDLSIKYSYEVLEGRSYYDDRKPYQVTNVTGKNYKISRLLEKLGLKDRTQLAVFEVKNHLD